jgi:hypothetical protein
MSISENRIRKKMNFGKRFPKTIYESKIEILEGSEETLEGRKEKFNHYPVSLGHFKRIFFSDPEYTSYNGSNIKIIILFFLRLFYLFVC